MLLFFLLLQAAVLCASLCAATRPIWLTIPSCKSEDELARSVNFMLPVPRRVEETHVDCNGADTVGRCLPYSLLLQMQRGPVASQFPNERDLPAIEAFRDQVLDFGVEHQAAVWGQDNCGTLGDVIAAVAQFRGWTFGGMPRSAAVRVWAAKLRANPREGCDAAFLFTCAAQHGLNIHVHYERLDSGRLQDTQFAVPSTADTSTLRPPRSDVHVGFCDNGDGTAHYVSLPPLFSRAA